MGHNRRRSHSSSSSSSSSSSGSEKKFKKDKKNKHGGPAPAPGFPTPEGSHQAPFGMPHMSSMPVPGVQHHDASRGLEGGPAPPPYPGSTPAVAPPPSGYRIPLSDGAVFPQAQAGPPAAYDGDRPVFLGSALFERAVHPCKIIPAFTPPPRVDFKSPAQQDDDDDDDWARVVLSAAASSPVKPVRVRDAVQHLENGRA